MDDGGRRTDTFSKEFFSLTKKKDSTPVSFKRRFDCGFMLRCHQQICLLTEARTIGNIAMCRYGSISQHDGSCPVSTVLSLALPSGNCSRCSVSELLVSRERDETKSVDVGIMMFKQFCFFFGSHNDKGKARDVDSRT
jgi:hypothetical protein